MVDFSTLKMGGPKTPRKIFRQTPPLFLVPDSAWGPRKDLEEGRFYCTPEGKHYPSVTTFLGHFEDDSFLLEWRKRVGEEEANRISEYACLRGETVHAALEAYVKNEPNYNVQMAGRWQYMFNQIRRVIDRKLDSVCYSEHAVYSNELKIAGRVDLRGVWNGFNSIIDFKNKNRMSKKEDVQDYFLQAATYAIADQEMYGTKIEKLVILLGIDDEAVRECQVMEEFAEPYIAKVREMSKQFQAESGLYKIAETLNAS